LGIIVGRTIDLRNIARFERKRPAHEKLGWMKDTCYIWYPNGRDYFEQYSNQYCHFRKTFMLQAAAEEADIRIFADSRYMLYVNGKYICRGPCRSDPRWQYFDVIEISEYLNEGLNSIAVFVVYYGYGTGQYEPRQPLLMFDGCISLVDESKLELCSDNTWKCKESKAFITDNVPRINGRQGAIEVYDAREELDGWTRFEYDDSKWENALSLRKMTAKSGLLENGPFYDLVPRDIPLLEETVVRAEKIINKGTCKEKVKTLDTIHMDIRNEISSIDLLPCENKIIDYRMEKCEDGYSNIITIDFGKVEAGYLMLDVSGSKSTVIDILSVEELWEGKVIFDTDSRPIDRLILGQKHTIYETAFAWKAFRYVQLIIRNHEDDVIIHWVGIRRRCYPIDIKGEFIIQDKQLHEIRQMCLHTLRLCMQDAFLDSSSREQQQWMGDGRLQAIYNYYISGDKRLHRKLLEQIGQSQHWTGITRARHPDGHHSIAPIPSFTLAWVNSFKDYLMYTDENGLLFDWWPNIVQAMRWFTAYENDEGLLEDVPYWMFIDWGDMFKGKVSETMNGGIVTALNIQYLEAILISEELAHIVGDDEAEANFLYRYERLNHSIKKELWNEELQVYSDCVINGRHNKIISEQSNTLAILHLHELRDERFEKIKNNVLLNDDDNIVSGSPFFMVNLLRALIKAGLKHRALDIIRKRYGHMLDNGATTVWELWDLFKVENGKVNRMVSASHAWGSAPILFFVEGILGIEPLVKGFEKFTINPELCGLGSVSGSVPTPKGVIKLDIREEGRKQCINIFIPGGCTGLFEGKEYAGGTYQLERIV